MVSPEKVFKVGACRASIFINEVVKEGKRITMPKVVFQIRYRDKDGQWKGTSSLGINDIPKAILALEKAYEYLTTKGREKSNEESI